MPRMFAGGVGAISCFSVPSVTSARRSAAPKKSWSLAIASAAKAAAAVSVNPSSVTEATAVAVDASASTAGRVFAGCSDGAVHIYDLETR